MPTSAHQENNSDSASISCGPLITAMRNTPRPAAPSGARSQLRVARLRAIADDILQHLNHHELTIGAVARRQRISDSYIRKLFRRHETNYSQFVLHQRLARARALLSVPDHADRTILSIAFDVGFGDLSYFNRTFRRCYGTSPSRWRRHALHPQAADQLA